VVYIELGSRNDVNSDIRWYFRLVCEIEEELVHASSCRKSFSQKTSIFYFLRLALVVEVAVGFEFLLSLVVSFFAVVVVDFEVGSFFTFSVLMLLPDDLPKKPLLPLDDLVLPLEVSELFRLKEVFEPSP